MAYPRVSHLILIVTLLLSPMVYGQATAEPSSTDAPASTAQPAAAEDTAAADQPAATDPTTNATPATTEPADSDDGEPAAATATAPAAATTSEAPEQVDTAGPLIALGVGIATVLGLIIVGKVNAFIALIVAAFVVSLIAAAQGNGDWTDAIKRVTVAFGDTAGNIAIVIGFAAVIGKCMLDSGAADRIVRAFLALFGEKRSPVALMGSGFVLAVPVFFDTVFYLLVPLARSLFRKTKKNYLLYIMAIGAGGAITHTLVPPTPGPLLMASNLKFDVGTMIMVGAIVAMPAAIVGVLFSQYLDKKMPIPMRQVGNEPEPDPLKDEELPSLGLALLPVILPVALISGNTVVNVFADGKEEEYASLLNLFGVIGNPSFALLVSMLVSMFLLVKQRGMGKEGIAHVAEQSLMSGGVIILITAAGGAFGGMLKAAQVGGAIKSMFEFGGDGGPRGLALLFMAYVLAAILKVAQGSSTAAMIIGSGMMAAIADAPGVTNLGEYLGYHPVYLATAIGAGSLMGSWMNDSGFWIFAKMGGLTEAEALKSWTVMLAVLSVTSFVMTVILTFIMPMV